VRLTGHCADCQSGSKPIETSPSQEESLGSHREAREVRNALVSRIPTLEIMVKDGSDEDIELCSTIRGSLVKY
jgi:hypothetical protein